MRYSVEVNEWEINEASIKRNDSVYNFFLSKEYLPLREEVRSNIKEQRTFSTFAITVSLSFIAAALTIEGIRPEIFLLPLAILCVVSVKVREIKKSSLRIIGYIYYWAEKEKLNCWEKMLYDWRNYEEEKNKGFKKLLEGMLNWLATFDMVIMAALCIVFYAIKFPSSSEGINGFLIVAIILFCMIFTFSINHWRISCKEINDEKEKWKNIIELNQSNA